MEFPAARRGATVVLGGLACSIGVAPYRGRIAADCQTISVLGTEVDTGYLASSILVARALTVSSSWMMSEYLPGAQSCWHHFPFRKLIVRSLPAKPFVNQAPASSGVLITAEYALGRDRRTLLHAAGVDDALCSTGPAALAADGAQILHTAAEALIDSTDCRAPGVGMWLSQSLEEELAGRAAGYGDGDG